MAKRIKSTNSNPDESAFDTGLVDLKNFTSFDDKISTGSLMFDWFLGGGFGAGLYRFGGSPERGKTAQALTWAAAWLRSVENSKVMYFDAEARITPFKLKSSPLVDVPDFADRVILTRCNIYEEIATRMFDLIKDNSSGVRYFFVIDSLDMVMSERDLNYAFSEDEKMASVAKLSKRLMRRSGPYLRINGHHLHVLSQMTANIGSTYGPQDKSDFGGHSIKHATDLWGNIKDPWGDDIIWENPTATTKADKGKVLGHYCKITFDKTMNDRTGQSISIPIRRATQENPKSGVWRSRELGDLMMMLNIVKKSGAWFSIDEEYINKAKKSGLEVKAQIQGANNFYEYLESNEELSKFFEELLKKTIL